MRRIENITKLSFVGMLAFTLIGCLSAPTYSDKALQIQVHMRAFNLLDKCKNLGPVNATARDKTMGNVWAERIAKNNAREQVYDLKGDTLLILNVERLNGLTSEIQGIAFKCY